MSDRTPEPGRRRRTRDAAFGWLLEGFGAVVVLASVLVSEAPTLLILGSAAILVGLYYLVRAWRGRDRPDEDE